MQLLWGIFEVEVNVSLFFYLTKSFFLLLLPGTHPFPNHLLAIKTICVFAQFFQIYILVWTRNDLCTVINFALHFLPAAQLFSFPPLTSFQVWLDLKSRSNRSGPRFSSRSVGNGEKKALHGRGDEKHQPHLARPAVSWQTESTRCRAWESCITASMGEKKNSCAARLCNVGEMKSDVAGTCWSCRNLRFDNPTPNILGHFTICGTGFLFAK